MNKNSNYAEAHKRASKPKESSLNVNFRLGKKYVDFVTLHYPTKSDFYIAAVQVAAEQHPKWED